MVVVVVMKGHNISGVCLCLRLNAFSLGNTDEVVEAVGCRP